MLCHQNLGFEYFKISWCLTTLIMKHYTGTGQTYLGMWRYPMTRGMEWSYLMTWMWFAWWNGMLPITLWRKILCLNNVFQNNVRTFLNIYHTATSSFNEYMSRLNNMFQNKVRTYITQQPHFVKWMHIRTTLESTCPRKQCWPCPTTLQFPSSMLPQLWPGLSDQWSRQRPRSTWSCAGSCFGGFLPTPWGGQLNFYWAWWKTQFQDRCPQCHGLPQPPLLIIFRWLCHELLVGWCLLWDSKSVLLGEGKKPMMRDFLTSMTFLHGTFSFCFISSFSGSEVSPGSLLAIGYHFSIPMAMSQSALRPG